MASRANWSWEGLSLPGPIVYTRGYQMQLLLLVISCSLCILFRMPAMGGCITHLTIQSATAEHLAIFSLFSPAECSMFVFFSVSELLT